MPALRRVSLCCKNSPYTYKKAPAYTAGALYVYHEIMTVMLLNIRSISSFCVS